MGEPLETLDLREIDPVAVSTDSLCLAMLAGAKGVVTGLVGAFLLCLQGGIRVQMGQRPTYAQTWESSTPATY